MADADMASRSEAILVAEAERVRALLRRYLSPRVADAVLEERQPAQGPGRAGVVSVLFCDLRGFTAYSERTPPAEVARLLNDFLKEMTEAVFKYDGMLDKYMGDGLMAVFGVPYPQEDHAARAVHAALEMQVRHEQLMQQWTQERRIGLGLGIGIESGEVTAGNFGSAQRVDYTVIGHSVNLASRLTGIAPPGQILLGEGTRRLAGALAEVEPLGPAHLKNVSDPVAAYRLMGLRPGASGFCLECGRQLAPAEPFCPTCGARRDTFLAPSRRDGLVTVANVLSTRTAPGRPHGPRLIAVAGPHQGADFAVSVPCSIGREALTNQIVLSLDPAVSRRHALLRRDERAVLVLADLASQNGTYVNDRPIDVAEIHDGDVISIGRTHLVASGLQSADGG